jgi:basic amino acid/polyamine antiporter, APA family
VQTLATLMLAVTGTFERLAILANVAALALYLGCALASWRLRAAGVTGAGDRTAVPLGVVAPFLAIPVILWLLTGLTRDEWLGFGAAVVISSLVYVVARRRA